MISEEERNLLHAGKVAQELVQSRGWAMFTESIKEIRRGLEENALRRGDTDFEKGAVFGFNLAVDAPQATIEARDRLLADMRARGDEDGEAPEDDANDAKEKEQVP